MTADSHNENPDSEKDGLVGKESAPSSPEAPSKPARRRNFHITVYEAWCKKCGICVEFCPAGALREHETTQQVIGTDAKCTGCHQCEWRCPDFAIMIKPVASRETDSSTADKKEEKKE